jgi:ATP-dependent DNA ligase
VIVHRGKSLFQVPLQQRREILGDTIRDLKKQSSLISLSDMFDVKPAELIPLVKQFGFEGIVAKRKDSFYEIGKRTGAWAKFKVNKGQEFVIGGYRPGNLLDSVIIGYYEGNKLVYAAKVRNGFVPRLGREVWAELRHKRRRVHLPISRRKNARSFR